MARFRLILSPPLSGAENMALDEAILEATASGASPPTVRLYAWSPACLSLGYAQASEAVDLQALRAVGWELVRRPTGGKAILHTDELTYSIAGPADHPLLHGEVLASYRRLSAGLLAGLRRLGLQPQSQLATRPTNGSNPICFQDPGAYELTVAGMKLLGSAQLRRAGGVLQHGSLPLVGDIARICRALKYANQAERESAAAGVRRDATTLEAALGRPVSWRQAADALAEGFRSGLDLELTAEQPSSDELRRTAVLVKQKYGNQRWNRRL